MFGGFLGSNNNGFGFGGNWPGNGGFPIMGGRFDEIYRAYSVAMYAGRDKQRDNYGGKVILPTSAMHKLTAYMSENPIVTLAIQSAKTGKRTHAGVLEFTAEEGRMYVPHWMLATLGVEEGELLKVSLAVVAKGKFIKIQAQSTEFLEITDPKAVLENAFRNYQFMTTNDVITFEYNNKTYDIKVLEVKPSSESNAVMTVDTDIEVDFAAPVGYVDPSESADAAGLSIKRGAGSLMSGFSNSMNVSQHSQADAPDSAKFSAFGGSGKTIGSKVKRSATVLSDEESQTDQLLPSSGGLHSYRDGSAVPAALLLPFGKLYFGYPVVPLKEKAVASDTPQFKGKGVSLRSATADTK